MIPSKLRIEGIRFVLIEPKGKKPFQKDWTNKNISWDNEELNNHLQKGGNYGVMGGGEKKLLIVDFDNEKVQEEVIKKLPKTFTVKTGSGLLHKYFLSDNSESFKIFDEKLNTLADVQGDGKQVVGPGSVHPNGNNYSIVDNETISFIDYAELKAILMPYDKKPKKRIKVVENTNTDFDNEFGDEIKSRISMPSLLSDLGIDITKNPTNCPFHASDKGKCLGFTDETAHCFHCDDSWNIFSMIMQERNCNYAEALDYFAEKEGLVDELKESRKKWAKKNKQEDVVNNETEQELKRVIERFEDKEDLVKQIFDIQPYFYDRAKLWWLWDSKEFKWNRKDETDMIVLVKNMSGANTVNSKHKGEILEAMRQEGRQRIPKEIKTSWIQFKNKIIDIKTGEEFEAIPEYFITNPINWKLGETEETPEIDKLFRSWVKEESVLELYEILAFCLVPKYFIHRIICLIGSGANGKGTYLRLLRKFIAEENVASTSLNRLMGRFEGSSFFKKLVCLMGETHFNTFKRTDTIKSMTGEDSIPCEFKGKDPFNFENYAKLIMATNSLPMTIDKTEGFYRRWKLIDFDSKFEKEKDVLNKVSDEEYENLALKCLNIVKRLWKERIFTNDGNFEDRKNRYEQKSNPLMLFIKEKYTKDVNGTILFSDFFEALNNFLKEREYRELTYKEVSQQLSGEGFEIKKTTVKGINGRFLLGFIDKSDSNDSNDLLSTPSSHGGGRIELQSLQSQQSLNSKTPGILAKPIATPKEPTKPINNHTNQEKPHQAQPMQGLTTSQEKEQPNDNGLEALNIKPERIKENAKQEKGKIPKGLPPLS